MCSGLGGCTGSVTSFGSRATSEIIAYSNSVGSLSDFQRAPTLPFFDEFPIGIVSPVNWSYNNGGYINTAGDNEPSPADILGVGAVWITTLTAR